VAPVGIHLSATAAAMWDAKLQAKYITCLAWSGEYQYHMPLTVQM